MSDPIPMCTCSSTVDELRGILGGDAPPANPCRLHGRPQKGPAQPVALNDDGGLARIIGLSLRRPYDDPPDAA